MKYSPSGRVSKGSYDHDDARDLGRKKLKSMAANFVKKQSAVLATPTLSPVLGPQRSTQPPPPVPEVLLDAPQSGIIQHMEATLSEFELQGDDSHSEPYPLQQHFIKYLSAPVGWSSMWQSYTHNLSTHSAQLQGEMSYLAKFGEQISFLIYFLSRARNLKDALMAVANFVSARTELSLLENGMDLIKEFFTDVLGPCFKSSFNLQGDDDQSTTSSDSEDSSDLPLSSLRDFLTKWDSLKSTKTYKKLYKFLLYLVSLNIFSKIGVPVDAAAFKNLYREAKKQNLSFGPDFVHSILETIVFLCQKGYQIIVTGSIDPIYHDDSAYGKWADKVVELRLQSAYLRDPEPHGIELSTYFGQLDACIEEGEAILRHAKGVGSGDAKFITHYLCELKTIKSKELSVKHALKMRPAPFALLIYGGSKVAKSTFIQACYYQYGKRFSLCVDDEYRYTRNASDPFWVNFKSYMWCVVQDDVAPYKPSAVGKIDETIVETLRIVNNIPYVPTQAALEDKGMTPLLARLVLMTTNTEHLNLGAYFSCPFAVARRMPYVIDLRPRKMYTRDGDTIEPELLPELLPGMYPDFWDIVIKKVIPCDNGSVGDNRMGKQSGLQVLHSFVDTFDSQGHLIETTPNIVRFMKWFNVETTRHVNVQKKVDVCEKSMAAIALCPLCGLGTLYCDCNGPTHTFEDEPLWYEKKYDIDPLIDPDTIMTPTYEDLLEDPELMARYEMQGDSDSESFDAALLEAPKEGTSMWVQRVGRVEAILDKRSKLLAEQQSSASFTFIRHNFLYSCYLSLLYALIQLKWGHYWCYLLFPLLPLYFLSPSLFWGYFVLLVCLRLYLNSNSAYWLILRESTDRRVVRYAFQKLGRAVQLRIGVNPYLSAIVMTLGTVWAWKKVVSMFYASTLDIQTNDEAPVAKPSSPNPWQKDEEENIWKRQELTLTPLDVTPTIIASEDEVSYRKIENNTFYIELRYPSPDETDQGKTRVRKGRWVGIGGSLYMTSNHNLPNAPEMEVTIVRSKVEPGITPNKVLRIGHSEIYRIPSRDVAFIYMRGLPPMKDISALIPRKSFNGKFDGNLVTRSSGGEVTRHPLKAISLWQSYRDANFDALGIEGDVWFAACEKATEKGDCGSPWIAETSYGVSLIGLHTLGDGGERIGALKVDQDLILEAKRALNVWDIQGSMPRLSAASVSRALAKTIHFKSPVNYIEDGSAEIFGTVSGHVSKMSSRVRRTMIADALVRYGYKETHGPPVLRHWMPKHRAMRDMVKRVTLINPDVLKVATDSFIADIRAGLSADDLKEVVVLSDMQAINGVPGVAYLDKMERSTSMGFPWQTTKKKFIIPLDPIEEWQNPVYFTEEIMSRAHEIEEQYKSGYTNSPVFCANLKDEATSLKKIADRKTRVFAGAPGDWSLIVRKYYLTAVRLVQKNRKLFECAVGVNSHSIAWNELYEHLTQFGPNRIVAGDFKNYDKSMDAIIMMEAFRVLHSIFEWAGFSAEELKVVEGIAFDISHPFYYFFGDLIRFFGTNPSGHPLTVVINSLVNSLFNRYCYILLNPDCECTSFKRNIALMTYGDDNIMGVSPEAPWFSHTSLQRVYATIGVEYTMAEKERDSVPYINISEATFLKRFWRYDPDFGHFVCKIEEDSIQKSLMCQVASRTITAADQCLETIASALEEYFYYGQEIFEEKREMFKKVTEECELTPYLRGHHFPIWDDLMVRYSTSTGHL